MPAILHKKVKLGRIDLHFLYRPFPDKNVKTLKSQIEINYDQLANKVKRLGFPQSHFLCEGGWYFNKPKKILKGIPSYNLFYFILSPSLKQLRRNYLSRTPRSKKDINIDSHWANYESKILLPLLNSNKKLKNKLDNYNMSYCEFSNESIKKKVVKTKEVVSCKNIPTLFIITGPNASGKSTLLLNIMRNFNINPQER